MVSNNQKHLEKIKRKAKDKLSTNDFKKIVFISSKEISIILDKVEIEPVKSDEIIKGYRITTEYQRDHKSGGKNIRERISKLLFKKSKNG
jgi:hypothetical protein